MIQDSSLDCKEQTTTPKTVATEFGSDFIGHAIKVHGSGTITITTKAGVSRQLTVGFDELVICQYTAVTASTGITGYRMHACRANP